MDLDPDVEMLTLILFKNCETGSRCRTDVDDPVHRALNLDLVGKPVNLYPVHTYIKGCLYES